MQEQGTVRIPLRGRGGIVRGYALVDEGDASWAKQWRWQFADCKPSYARRYVTVAPHKQRVVYMHRDLMGLKAGDPIEVDHVNRDGLDNRRSNLRLVSRAENGQNVRSRGPFRGVRLDRRTGRWRAEAKLAGRTVHIGYFSSPEEAATAASQWRAEHMTHAADVVT